ncbi:SIR2 family protein [Bradyrhizobium septentrionale]|uniref:SIR2 family protein n=1 Tax=Bradyrhizobium septentrionale TaxID=1404411 RepID=A0ABZ2NPV7_9BRAD|nr:SIR2 family protein [Bradyrhizobium septentrionale]UGY22920.1 SIR2 family protein [Bradyrhizobium septentrionale]
MRFLPTGADIPDDLIRAVTNGNVTFLCGAGVSHRAGLPMFGQLTADVYSRLGASPDDESAERRAIDNYEYDRALGSLEKRTRLPKAPSLVRDAVSELLKAPKRPLPDHAALLGLSCDAEGRPRLLTTNFDTLFERAGRTLGLSGVPSQAGISIPRAGGERDFGVLHLHGRIADRSMRLEASDLVLTSADFGDAYLRNGWASRYIEDRMRLGTLVLVGYRAEDAAMRLLLEALDADRDRFLDLGRIYAMEKGSPGSASIWKAKGITAIEFADYDAIYATIREWAQYNANPRSYGLARLTSILGTGAAGANP